MDCCAVAGSDLALEVVGAAVAWCPRAVEAAGAAASVAWIRAEAGYMDSLEAACLHQGQSQDTVRKGYRVNFRVKYYVDCL